MKPVAPEQQQQQAPVTAVPGTGSIDSAVVESTIKISDGFFHVMAQLEEEEEVEQEMAKWSSSPLSCCCCCRCPFVRDHATVCDASAHSNCWLFRLNGVVDAAIWYWRSYYPATDCHYHPRVPWFLYLHLNIYFFLEKKELFAIRWVNIYSIFNRKFTTSYNIFCFFWIWKLLHPGWMRKSIVTHRKRERELVRIVFFFDAYSVYSYFRAM